MNDQLNDNAFDEQEPNEELFDETAFSEPELDEADIDLEEPRQRPDLDTLITALSTEKKTVSAIIVDGLSGIDEAHLSRIDPVWKGLPPGQRRRIMRRLTETSEVDFGQDYSVFARYVLDDTDAPVRIAALEALWDDESVSTMEQVIQMAQHDPAIDVRAAASSALGHYILLGELDDLPLDEAERAKTVVYDIFNNPDEDVDVRRRALEAFSNSSDDRVSPAITIAYRHEDRRFQISAVFAMGKSCDERWSDTVLTELETDEPAMQYEAARSAGELEIEEAIPHLKALAFGDDVDIRDVAIWSLGEIGGKEATRALELLTKEAKARRDDDLIEAIEDAIAVARLGNDDMLMFRLRNE